MSETIADSIAKLITAPPGQLAAGGVLAGIVWKFFERVEAVLTEQTKLEIAVWLLDVKTANQIQSWPDTFSSAFDRTFGTKQVSWKFFLRSCMASYASVALVLVTTALRHGRFAPVTFLADAGGPYFQSSYSARLFFSISAFFILCIAGNIIPDYISLLKTRYILNRMQVMGSGGRFLWLAVDLCLTYVFATLSLVIAACLYFTAATWEPLFARLNGYLNTVLLNVNLVFSSVLQGHSRLGLLRSVWYYPAFFASVWLWLYMAAGLLLKVARRFDIGFQWYNRKFDIEKKPLSAIGLVAGALVAVVYWGFVAAAYAAHFASNPSHTAN